MKRILALVFAVLAPLAAGAQYNMDTDLCQFARTALPDFHASYGDYIQYAPGISMYALKACGIHNESTWGRMIATDAISYTAFGAMTALLKSTVSRRCPDGSNDNSFPSEHTGTAFMMASMMKHEFGDHYPLIGVAGYAFAVATAQQRILVDKHWATDTFAGAVIGIGATHLGYWLSDKIFGRKGLNCTEEHGFHYHADEFSFYGLETYCARRFVLGKTALKESGAIPFRGSSAGIHAEIPLAPQSGVCARVSGGSMLFNGTGGQVDLGNGMSASNTYALQGGLYWSTQSSLVEWFELGCHTMMGYSILKGMDGGINLNAGTSANFIVSSNYKLKAFAEWETMRFSGQKPYLNSVFLGLSFASYW